MAASELTIDQIHQFFKDRGNVVQNRDLVHHFKRYLTDPASKDDARSKFKRYVNILAQTRTEDNGDKFLVLKSKYLNSYDFRNSQYLQASPVREDPRISLGIPSLGIPVSSSHSLTSPQQPDYYNSPSKSSPGGGGGTTPRQPPPYRPPPPVSSPSPSFDTISLSSIMSFQDNVTPQAPPRRRSVEKQKSLDEGDCTPKRHQVESLGEGEEKLSFKEKTQKFNRLASIEDELSSSPRQPKSAEKAKNDNKGADEDDGASVASLEPKKCMEWYVTASKGDLQELVKLAKDEPRLVNRKDPFTTVLHWGAKHGNAEIIKVFAGRYKVDVNGKTNGGYTPLHLAAQFGHKDIFKLLIEVYKADTKIRDYSGRLPDYYLIAKEQKGRKDNLRKIKARKKQSDKDLGFLRIGSLNVRVKKTTEAFSNFLGVGTSVNPMDGGLEKVHKGWGSADNLNQENPGAGPKGNFVKKKSKNSIGGSIPGTPRQGSRSTLIISGPVLQQQQAGPGPGPNDSDSDSAAGFDSQWKN